VLVMGVSLISVTMWIVVVCGDLERKGEASGRGFAAIPCLGIASVET
jgi:hypothetical protein